MVNLRAGRATVSAQGVTDDLQPSLQITNLDPNTPMPWAAAPSGDLTHATSLKRCYQRVSDSAMPV